MQRLYRFVTFANIPPIIKTKVIFSQLVVLQSIILTFKNGINIK